MNKAVDKLSAADKQAFIDAAKEGTKANRARVDEDDAKGVADLRAKGMTVVDNVDKAKFVRALAPVNAEFEKQFGKANIDKIRNFGRSRGESKAPSGLVPGRPAFAGFASLNEGRRETNLPAHRALHRGVRLAGACLMVASTWACSRSSPASCWSSRPSGARS